MFNSLQFQQRFSNLAKTSAFTLTELLLAAMITTSVVAVSGIGLSAVISSSTAVNESTERQEELNRAMDFISAEIREARKINAGFVTKFLEGTSFWDDIDTVPVDKSSIEIILWLDVPTGGADINRNKVVYYIGEPQESNGPWRSPQVVYRWGPEFNEAGTYQDEVTDPDTGDITDANVEHAVLIDSMHDQINGGSDPNCGGWNAPIPSSAARNLGFYACVEPGNRVASLRQVGNVKKVLDRTSSLSSERQVYARASETIREETTDSSVPCPKCDGEEILPEDPDGGGFKVIKTSTLTIKNMGGAIVCGPGGPLIETETTVVLTFPNGDIETVVIPKGEKTWDVPRNTTVNFISTLINSPCGAFTVDSSSDIGTQIVDLVNGEEIPYYEPFDYQPKIEQFLTEEFLDGNRIKIEANQKVFLFELGEIFSENPGPAYDLQDVVILADIVPQITTTIDNTGQSSDQSNNTSNTQNTSQ